MKKLSTTLFFILVIVCWASSCTQTVHEEAVGYTEPTIKLDSCVVRSDNMFETYITVDKGDLFFDHQLELLIYDTNDLSVSPRIETINMQEERSQSIRHQVTASLAEHSYMVYARLTTKHHSFTDGPQIVTYYHTDLKYEYGIPHIEQSSLYSSIGADGCYMPGSRCIVSLYETAVKQPVIAKLGERIVQTEWSTSYYSSNKTKLFIDIPDDMPAGTYNLTLEFERGTLTVEEEIKVLPWSVSFMDDVHAATCTCEFGAMHIEDNMYYMFHTVEGTIFKSYDIKNNTWSTKKNVPFNLTLKVGCNGYGYGVDVKKQELMKYAPTTDEWMSLGKLPTKIDTYGAVIFAIGKRVYLGGGSYFNGKKIIFTNDFYSYDTETDKWKKLNDIPFGDDEVRTLSMCGGESTAYVLVGKGKLWIYDAVKDTWHRAPMIEQFYGVDNSHVAMIEHKGKLIMVEMTSIQAAYMFDPKTTQLDLMAYFTRNISLPTYFMAAAYIDNDQLIIGPQGAALYGAMMGFVKFDMNRERQN